MAAYLTTTYKRGFLLTEEALIKLDDLIRKRLGAGVPTFQLMFKVFRSDGMLIEYDSPSGVAAEENASRNAIRKLEIVHDAKPTVLKLTFDAKESVDLRLESDNRDLAYLLFSDLKEYLTAEVLKFRTFTFDSVMNSRITLPIISLLIPLATLVALRDAPKPDLVSQVLQSPEVHEKLNYLIQQSLKKDEFGSLKYLVFAVFGLMLVPLFLGALLDKAFPRNVFYWGKAATAYDRLLSIRDKVVWGVIIAFVIGIASTVAVDYFKPPAR